MGTALDAWKEKILVGIVGLLALGATTWCGWVTNSLVYKTTADDVKEIVKTEAPYIEDRNLIKQQITQLSGFSEKLTEVIQRNTDAINSLKIELAKIKID